MRLQTILGCRWKTLGLVLAFAMVFLTPTILRFSGFLDEGLVLAPALRVLQGEVVYRDFYLYSTPISVYLFAAFMKLFGTSVLSSSICLWLIRCFTVGGIYVLSRSCLSPLYALAPPLIFLLSFGHESWNLVGHWVASLTFVWAMVALIWSLEQESRTRWFIAGVAVSTAGMTLQTFGVALLLVGLVAYLPSYKKTLWWLLGVAMGALPWFVFFASEGAIHAFWQDAILSNLHRAGFEFVKPMTFLRIVSGHVATSAWYIPTALLLLLPPLVGSVGPLLVGRTQYQRKVWVVYSASILMLVLSFYRLLPTQLLMHHFLSVIMTVLVFQNWRRWGAWLTILFAATMLAPTVSYLQRDVLVARHWVEFPQGKVWVHNPREVASLTELVQFLQTHIAPGSEVQFTPYVPNLYYLMNIPGATRYVQMRSRQYSREQMEELLTSLKEKDFPSLFHFITYEDEGFLRANWPDEDPALYYQQRDWFRERLEENYRKRDFGAILLFEKK